MAKYRSFPLARRMPIALALLLTSLSGCAKDYSLAPPADSEQVTLRIKVPPELEAEKMEVMYRSATCKRVEHDGNGKPYELEGYHGIDVQPQRLGQSDIYEVKLARDGGGACRWHLANVTFGVTYREPERFGEGVISGAGGGVVVIFDHNNSPMGGANMQVDGDLIIKEDYYPWVKEGLTMGYTKTGNFFKGWMKRVSLLAGGDYYLKYQALQARQVYFEPILHSDFVVYSVQPREKGEVNLFTFTYPDGSVEKVSRVNPSFRKLEAIRMAAEKQK